MPRLFSLRTLSGKTLCASGLCRPIRGCLHFKSKSVIIRGVKTQSVLKLSDVPQGLLPIEPLPPDRDDNGPVYPTVVQQAKNHMKKFDNCVLLTRVGGFYELYFEHAERFGPLLNLKVASRKPSNAPAFAMAGFPFFQLDRYLKILVQDLNQYVAIAEEFRNEATEKVKSGALMHDRKISRIVTPGTLIDESFMDPFTNNYILSIHVNVSNRLALHPKILPCQPDVVGLAWLDLSTGQFFLQSTSLDALASHLARICPREIILDDDLQDNEEQHEILSSLVEDQHIVRYQKSHELKQMASWVSMLESPIPAKNANKFASVEIAAGSALLNYVETQLQGSNMKLQPPIHQLEVMGIDKHTMRALEIKKTMRDDHLTGSLLKVVRRTVTKEGARLLDVWLSSPSTSLDVINYRLDLVTYMQQQEDIRERIIMLLRRSHDSHRLLQKFAFGRGDPDDLLALASSIQATYDISQTLQRSKSNKCIASLLARINLDNPLILANRIRKAIDEESLLQQHRIIEDEEGVTQNLARSVVTTSGTPEDTVILSPHHAVGRKTKVTSMRDYNPDDADAWMMNSSASPTLVRLHTDLGALLLRKDQLAQLLSVQLGANTLTLRFTPGLGHICHVKGKDTTLSTISTSSSIRPVASSKSTRTFYHTAWTSLGHQIIEHKARIRTEELRVFNTLREAVIRNIIPLRRNAAVLAEIDIASSFAVLAAEKNWVRPVLNNSTRHNIIAGRHPTVEGGLEVEGRTFVTNACSVGAPHSTWLLTGPNMAGKSTFLRQNALITILAQTGSYVPALFAEIGIVDQIFSRVGSADNLYKDQSTFMVEMLETAHILRNATSRSFVIMDEVGRGTAPIDGTAISFACLSHLTTINQCRTLFATHFHALTDMIKNDKEMNRRVGFYCTDVKVDRDGKGFTFLHQLKPGVNKESHALRIARLAGLPEEAIMTAEIMLGARTKPQKEE